VSPSQPSTSTGDEGKWQRYQALEFYDLVLSTPEKQFFIFKLPLVNHASVVALEALLFSSSRRVPYQPGFGTLLCCVIVIKFTFSTSL